MADVYDAVEGTGYSNLRAQGAKPRKPKLHPRPTDKKPHQIGNRGRHSQESVLSFIQSRKPPQRVPSERVPPAEAVRGAVLLGTDPTDAPRALELGATALTEHG